MDEEVTLLKRKRKENELPVPSKVPKSVGAPPDSGSAVPPTTSKNCVHEVATPPDFVDDKDVSKFGTINEPVFHGEPAKEYPFPLDPFQMISVACLERRESVLVSAHTSAGKTAVAEYAIAMAFRDKQRVIYTSPLKALSNQKYRELSGEFGDVGLMTGDVTLSPNAACLVMTTEILRHMLYHGAETLREVAWVIFDEIHYMRDRERGVVWEESIIFLPPSVKMVFLSATITNAREFAEWVCHLHTHPCHVVYTDYRPTPLQHYAFAHGGNGLYLIVDEMGRFREDNFLKLMEAFDRESLSEKSSSKKWKGKVAEGKSKGKGDQGKKDKDSNDIYKIVKMIMEKKMQPVIVFSFARRECEANAMQMAKLDFNSEEEKAAVEEVFTNAISLLKEEDRTLPAIELLLPILKRGVGVHHSGLLPILKEVIEILFQEGLIKALFATETFAMGLNMPAKTVVFTSLRKWDGEQHRWMGSGEYIQMSGRAGRRGKDDRGICIMMVDEQMDMATCKELVLGRPAPLESSFRLTYYALLNLMARAEGQINAQYVIAQSFHQFQHEKTVPLIEAQIKQLEGKLAAMDAQTKDSVAEFHRLRLQLSELERSIMAQVLQPHRSLHVLSPGRLLRVRQGATDWGWGVLVRVTKRSNGGATAATADSAVTDVASTGSASGARYLLDVLLHCAVAGEEEGEAEEEGAAGRKVLPKPCPAGNVGDMAVIPTDLSLVTAISSLRIALPADLRPHSARMLVLRSLKELARKFQLSHAAASDTVSLSEDDLGKGSLPVLDPIKDFGIAHDEGFLALVAQKHAVEERLRNLQQARAKKESSSEEHAADLSLYHVKAEKSMQIQELRGKMQDSQLSTFRKELHQRSRVLQRLGYVSKEGVVQLKGRAACLINTADELLATELLFDSAFSSMSSEQIVALCSCFLPSEKSSETPTVCKELTVPFRHLQDTARRIAQVQKEEKLSIEPDEYVDQFKPSLMDVMFSWAKGSTFAQVCDLTDMFEGSIVRAANRLNELLGEMMNAARAVGDEALQSKFQKASECIKRGIMFANSLYLDDS